MNFGSNGWGTSLTGYGAVLDLLESISVRFDGDATYIVGPTVNYAVHHEKGTSKMEARPFAKPAAERVQANLSTKVGEFLDGGLTDADEEALVRATALAVQSEMQRIADAKDIRDTGALIASISVEKV